MTPEEIAQLRLTDPAALTRAFARYDHAGIVALSEAYSAFRGQHGTTLSPARVRVAWCAWGHITHEQAFGTLQPEGGRP